MYATSFAQLNHDNRLPPEDDDFLETEDGQQWLTDSVDDLLNRRDIKAPNATGKERVLVSYHRLTDALFQHMTAQIDPAHCVEQILIELIRRGASESLHPLAVCAIGGEKIVSDLAADLISPCANTYRDAKRESDRIEAECGF